MSSEAIRRAPPAAPATAAVLTAQVFALASNPLLACTLAIPGKLALEGKRWRIRAEGNCLTAGAFTANMTLLGATSIPAAPLVAANWTALAVGTARAIATTWAPWWMEFNGQFDSLSGQLQGFFSQQVNNLFTAPTVSAAALTGINGTNGPVTQVATVVPPADPVAYFAVAITFSAAGANVGNLYNFELGF